jgi:CDP-diacylglycerol---glycerol-3-phosphate 3-phosphatidyltransferase
MPVFGVEDAALPRGSRRAIVSSPQEAMNFPNALTAFRIVLIPPLVAVLLVRFEEREIIGAAIYVLASATDWLDGYLARRWKQTTVLGQLLDPVADKMLTSAVLITLVHLHVAPVWIVVALIGREFAVTGFRMVAASQSLVIPAHFLGKAKTFAEAPTLLILILGANHLGPYAPVAGKLGLYVVLTLSMVSGTDYIMKFWRRINFDAPSREDTE